MPNTVDSAPTIIATEENRVIIEAGNQAYVRGMGDSKEENWFVYRRGKPLVDPDTNNTLGYEAIYLGTARLTRAGDPATVRLTTVTQEVGRGDKLLPAGVPEVPKYAPHAPAVFMQGRIIGIYGGLGKVGLNIGADTRLEFLATKARSKRSVSSAASTPSIARQSSPKTA